MRQFRCVSCGHQFSQAFGSGQSGRQMKCPQCGGIVYREDFGGFGAGCGRGGRNGGRAFGQGRGGSGGRASRGICRRIAQNVKAKGGSSV